MPFDGIRIPLGWEEAGEAQAEKKEEAHTEEDQVASRQASLG